MVADSHLVTDSQVVGLNLHRKRFSTSAQAMGFSHENELPGFFEDCASRLRHKGKWFPRYELISTTSGLSLALRIRPAPHLNAEGLVSLMTAATDPRHRPTIKGPNIETLATLNASTRAGNRYADDGPAKRTQHETLLSTAEGQIAEGTTTSLLWWKDDVLHHVPDDVGRVWSVTENLVRGIALRSDITIVPDPITVSDLLECAGSMEIWAVNALHGIRRVCAIDNMVVSSSIASPTPTSRKRLQHFSRERMLSSLPL